MTAEKKGYDLPGVVFRSPWFEGLPERAHLRLAEAASVHHYSKSAYLYSTGEASKDVYCILSGRVRLLLSSTIGQEFAIRDIESEAWLGEQFMAHDFPTAIDARVLESATVAVIPRSVVLAVGDEHPLMYKNIFKHHMRRSRGVWHLLTGMAFYPLRSRLAGRLLALIEEHGHPGADGVSIDINMSQTDFAQLSLGSRQRINKILSEWREKEIIEVQTNHYVVRDIDALREELELKDDDD
ncbi:MAG: helix-turn-helix domain-containing protein [Gammaproteobacteria bacterium]|jgi:CRP-like cAMP-binding protein|nr:helix-turn-helix domain-containing protein [Gammaproteobacteria bacterium]